jgi:glyoxylase-like metal-dependent hydrolase (beta-lactamase superfamily II)
VPADVAEILPGLLRFTVPFPNDPKRLVNSFVLHSDDEALLVDASWSTEVAWEGLEAALARVGLRPESIKTVVITHAHVDHVGLAARLRELGARIAYHTADAVTFTARYRRMDEFREHALFWQMLNGFPESEEKLPDSQPLVDNSVEEVPDPDVRLQGGETLEIGTFRLRPVWTPGHTLGHLCYWEERQRLLFTGDHVLPTITPHVGMYFHAIGNPLMDYLDSLMLLRNYRPELVLPAHGAPFGDLHGRLDELLEHHHERMEELAELVGDEPVSAWEVASRARWTRRRISLQEVAPRHRRLALAETIAHLELLRAEHRVTKVASPGLICYRRADDSGS